MKPTNHDAFMLGLQRAWLAEQASLRIYRDLARREKSPARQKVLLKLAESEQQHADRWANRLWGLDASLPTDHENLAQRHRRWVLVQSGIENAEDKNIDSFTISALAHFLIGAAKTIITGLSPWKRGPR